MKNPPLQLLLIDADAIFRLGLSVALTSWEGMEVTAQADTPETALARLAEETPDIAILEPDFKSLASDGWQLCQQIRQQYPAVKICLLTAWQELPQLLAARASGVEGYCPKGTPIEEIVAILRQLAAAETNWQALAKIESGGELPRLLPARPQQWLVRWRQSGLAEIEAELNKVEQQLTQTQLTLFNSLFWRGRRRELRAARWLVHQLLPVEVVTIPAFPSSEGKPPAPPNSIALSLVPASEFPPLSFAQSSNAALVFNNTLVKMQAGVVNLTKIPLEIDVLQPDKKRELLYIVLQQGKRNLEKLRFLKLESEKLLARKSLILQEIWQDSLHDFFDKYYNLPGVRDRYNLDTLILQELEIIPAEILAKIPLAAELFNYLLLEGELAVDGVAYRPEAPEARNRAELLLQNVIIQIANGVMAFILNNFSEVEAIKQALYQPSLLSSREIARFRNNLSWRYRVEKYWQEPKAIFESQYRLFTFNSKGIKTTTIYASRQEELQQLRGIAGAVTLALETRDALSPRLRAIVSFVGNGLVYILTQVIGRGLGLIGRGIIQGIGNSLQDTRYGKNSEPGK